MASSILWTFLLMCGFAKASDVTIESFDQPSLTWKQQNDPVMGGRSTGTFTIQQHLGVFDGDVVDVPFLKAPGFIKVNGDGSFPDVSMCSELEIIARARQNYTGFRVSFGYAKPPGGQRFSYGYKAHFDSPVGSEFKAIKIPFTDFSDLWNDGTGAIIKTCAEDHRLCPDKATLKDMKTLQIWGEGVAGSVHLEIKSIKATSCSVSASPNNSTCSGKIQPSLRYNLSHTAAAEDWGLPLPPGTSLASAVCCDPFYAPYAEPKGLFSRSDVKMFAKFHANQTVTFYDSVCGIPLFVAPRGRTLEDFEADTTEHGWPSFRPEELVQGNSRIDNATGYVLSKCGTHLGSYLPDEKGPRWCLDLACISGNPSKAQVN